MLLSSCCITKPIPQSPPRAEAIAAPIGQATIPPHRLRVKTKLLQIDGRVVVPKRFVMPEHLREFIEDEDLPEGMNRFERFGVVTVSNVLPPARVREPDFPCSIFTRTRSRTQRAAVPRSFPSCPSPAKRQRRS